jgi:hypothetical protein
MGIWIGGVGQEVILSVTSFYNYLRPTILGRFSKKNEQLLYLTLACETAALYVGSLFNRFQNLLLQSYFDLRPGEQLSNYLFIFDS